MDDRCKICHLTRAEVAADRKWTRGNAPESAHPGQRHKWEPAWVMIGAEFGIRKES